MEPNAEPQDYIYKDGIYLEGVTARARHLSGEEVRPYTTPEALAQKVLGLTADQAAKVVEKTDQEWDVSQRHDIVVMLLDRKPRPAPQGPIAHWNDMSLDPLRRIVDNPAGYDYYCRIEPNTVGTAKDAVDTINLVMNAIRERGYFEICGVPVPFDGASRPVDGRFDLHISSSPNAVWVDEHPLSGGFGFHVWFESKGRQLYRSTDASDLKGERVINLMRYAFIDALNEHENDPYWARHRVRPYRD